jgi:regulator of PEP synthase PpsR (kinase-PPPase family)
MAPEQLVELRRVRAEKQGIPVEAYASAQQVHKELQYATELSRKHGWRRIDVTTKSVEEVCREIIALLPSREEG